MAQKPHALCIPVPAHGHINAMLKLANILHFKDFQITFVNLQFNTPQLLISQGFDSLPIGFRFETISASSATSSPNDNVSDIAANILALVRNLIAKLNSSSNDSPVSCIIWDCLLPCFSEFTDDFEIPQVSFWTMSTAVLTAYLHKGRIIEKIELHQDKNQEFMNIHVDFIPGLENLQIKDLPSFFWDGNDFYQKILTTQVEITLKAPAIILHTFDALETKVLQAIKPLLPPVYTIGPLNCIEQQIPDKDQRSFKSNQFKENQECIYWLDSQRPNSVVYVNFGSTTVMTRELLIEFGWGLANCRHPFLWVIRADLVKGDDATLPCEFLEETADRSMICSWCPQEKVLHHSSTAVFLTHSGWNSIMDTVSAGVPVINWPFFADQQTNCWSTCVQWGIGVEIDKHVKRNVIEELIREVMEGVKGKEMKKNAMDWKKMAEASTKEGGSSYENLKKVVKEVLLLQKKKA